MNDKLPNSDEYVPPPPPKRPPRKGKRLPAPDPTVFYSFQSSIRKGTVLIKLASISGFEEINESQTCIYFDGHGIDVDMPYEEVSQLMIHMNFKVALNFKPEES